MSFTSAITYDFEVFSAAQEKWLEVSSVSNFESFQTNRMKIRFKDEKGKMQLAHSLNGSSLALPRILPVFWKITSSLTSSDCLKFCIPILAPKALKCLTLNA